MELYDIIIIGSGPAGYTAAIYASRADLRVLLFGGGQIGGQLMTTTEVENYPGFPEGIMGPELMENFKKQAERFGTKVVAETVESVDLKGDPKLVKTAEAEYQGKSVIIATGAEARWLSVSGENEYRGRGVSACATCDGFFFKDKEIAVVGGGDSAMEEATFLTRFASKVTVLVRGDELKASEIMQKRAEDDQKIEFMYNTEVKEILGDEKGITKLKIINNQSNEETELDVQGLFVAIGRKPSTEIFSDQLELQKGYIKTKPDTTATDIPGVFAAGDVRDWVYRQAVWAAGDGCAAALDAKRYLEEIE